MSPREAFSLKALESSLLTAEASETAERRRHLRSVREEDPVGSLDNAPPPHGISYGFKLAAWLRLKRCLDVVTAALALIALAPALLVVGALVKATSDGPIFFYQTRLGRGARPFKMWKFRTMVKNAEELKAALADQNEASGPVFKIKRDPRITPVGAVLRKFSIDELPQLWNILRGEMTFVGPRPPVPSEVVQYRRWQMRRLDVKPGLTCIWQVSGRSKIGFEEWSRMDIRYIEAQSFWLDLKILWRTVGVVVRGDGAY